ncbi:helix-turn-helix transcriptional regulator [Croceivirga sp. JEA036]|nr:helix-turn-helix transcriptional regulator [Croceivirga sp. JEA036]NJB35558.1 helix-turn-helix transcriptional regulator [Croceivirga sp. JEA036]
MIDRLKQIMEYYKQNSTAFADQLGVPRSSISHLLSGRNKPSLDFILKLINTYPEVNLYWFLNGKGEFPSATLDKQNNLSGCEFQESENTQNQLPISPTNTTKEIKQIMVLYTDGTFDTYLPRK